MKLQYYSSCVDWPCKGYDDLSTIIDNSIDVTRRTFLKHVDQEELSQIERALGYEEHHSKGLTMAQDWHVTYHRSNLKGRRVYYFQHSRIEYVFCDPGWMREEAF